MANTNTTTKKDEVKELKAQLKEQQKKIDQLMSVLSEKSSKVESEVKHVIEDNNDISSDDEILVISLVPNKLNILGEQDKVLFSFNGMYDEQYVDYASLRESVRTHREMAQNGRYYIADERAVAKLKLKNHYRKVLTPKQFEDILKNNINTATELYKMAPEGQQKVIINIIKEKRANGINMDMNMLHELSEISNTDLVNVENVMSINTK